MSEPAKDEADLVKCMAKALHDSFYKGQTKWEDTGKFERYYREVKAEAAIAAIRAAGWAVVPVALMEEAADVLEDVIIQGCEEELPAAIRAMLAAAPEVKP
jgi:hypothetical protein